MTEQTPEFIYKIVTRSAFEAARSADVFPRMPIDGKDGFVHFSTAPQLGETLRLHFKGQSGLVVFAVRSADLADLRWEASRGGQLFPHLYGALLPASVRRVDPLPLGADGRHVFPALD